MIWYNEFQVYAHCDREPGEKLSSWQVRYVELNEAIVIVIYNENDQSRWGEDPLALRLITVVALLSADDESHQ